MTQVLARSDRFSIRTEKPVHTGKVRSVYWLTPEDSQRLIQEKSYSVAKDTELAVMIISDRISAFECNWRGESLGVPGKGLALNTIAAHWFEKLSDAGIGEHHIVDVPHPLVWIVQRARPVLVEAIARRYLTGSMWRAYGRGERVFGDRELPDGMEANQRISPALMTPTTKGVLSGIPGVPEEDDTPVSPTTVREHYAKFALNSIADYDKMETMLMDAVESIAQDLEGMGQIFVDTKFELGYVKDTNGCDKLIYIDEVGTPDSSRYWEASSYQEGRIVEYTKEYFRRFLLDNLDRDVLTDSKRMEERKALAESYRVPSHIIEEVSRRYLEIAEKIRGTSLPVSEDPEAEINAVLKSYQLLK